MVPPADYKPYKQPKKGLFKQTTDEYRFPDGWVTKDVEATIIGEDDISYVTRLLESKSGKWVGDIVVETDVTIALGFHKTRLVKWLPTQLGLF